MFNTKVDMLVLVKALGITLVVAEHARVHSGLHGGMNVLILVSGIAMATFAFSSTTAQTLRAFRLFCLRIAVPAFLIALGWGLLRHHIRWTELAFISNWIDVKRVVLFPIWYVQAMVQLMLAFAVIFKIFDLTPRIVRSPVLVTGSALALAVIIHLISYALWDTRALHDKLPHQLAWNFIFGWFYWALAVKGEKTLRTRLILTGTLAVCESLVYGIAGSHGSIQRVEWLSLFGLILIWVDTIRLPYVLARIVILISQATFYIFILHYFCFELVRKRDMSDHGSLTGTHLLTFAAGIVLPVLAWALITAVRRASARMKLQQTPFPA